MPKDTIESEELYIQIWKEPKLISGHWSNYKETGVNWEQMLEHVRTRYPREKFRVVRITITALSD